MPTYITGSGLHFRFWLYNLGRYITLVHTLNREIIIAKCIFRRSYKCFFISKAKSSKSFEVISDGKYKWKLFLILLRLLKNIYFTGIKCDRDINRNIVLGCLQQTGYCNNT